MKEHCFTLIVKTNGGRKSAETAVLYAFAGRNPDGCEFHLKKIAGEKEIWMAGERSGSRIAANLISASLSKLVKILRGEKLPKRKRVAEGRRG